MAVAPADRSTLGRYELESLLAVGGMGSVHRAVLRGEGGFTRAFAIKRLHPHLLLDERAVRRFLREARLGACVRHPNVVPIVDVDVDGEPFLVMELVDGPTLARVLRVCSERRLAVPIPIAVAIVGDLLAGLHAAHEAKGDRDQPLELVHRDVSPQNVLVGFDGLSRLTDFGIARDAAVGRDTVSATGGKLRYMAPEQLEGESSRRTDVHAAAIVLWETLVGKNLRRGKHAAEITYAILEGDPLPPSAIRSEVPPAIDAVVMRGLAREPSQRFESAEAMKRALEQGAPRASTTEVAEWIASIEQTHEPVAFARVIAGVEEEETPPTAVDSTVPAPTVPVSRKRSLLGLGVFTAAVAIGGIAYVSLRPRAEPTVAAAVESPPGLTPSSPSGSTPATSEVTAPVEAPGTRELPIESRPAASASANGARSTRAGAPLPRRTVTKPDCKEPYVLLPDGRKHFRAECFR